MEAFKTIFFVGSKDIVEAFVKEEVDKRLWLQTCVVLDELIFLVKKDSLDLFKTKIISNNLNLSERFVRRGINSLVDLKILNKKRTKTFTYEVNTQEILKKLKVKSLEEIYVSRTRYVSSVLFETLKTKNDLADIMSIKLYCHMKYMSQSNPNFICLITDSYICKNFFCSINTAKAYLRKLEAFNLIKYIEKEQYSVLNEENVVYVDNYVDNFDNYVDNSVDNFNLHFELFDDINQNAKSAYSNNQGTNIDKEIYGFSCEKEEEKILGVPLEKTPPPTLDSQIEVNHTINYVELAKMSSVLEAKATLNVESTITDEKASKKRDNQKVEFLKSVISEQKLLGSEKIKLKPELKTFEELIPYELNIIKYEDFIYRLEKRCDFKRSSDFIKKLVRKLSEKYSHYKFKDLDSVENYFCKAIENELLDTKLTNSTNFRYNYEINENRRF
jgi:hypothetical protein